MRPIAIITGATAGIGRATAMALGRNNYDVVITGRRAEKLEGVEEDLFCDADTFEILLRLGQERLR